MKNMFKVLLGFLFLGFIISSCEKDENKIFFEGGTAPVLTASTTADQVLLKVNENNPAIIFNWTNPDYKFTTGISSQDVTYTMQFDVAGANFGSTKKYEKAIARELTSIFTVRDLNAALLAMDLPENVVHNIEIRIKSSLVNNSVPLYSNVIAIKMTPYLDVVYPVPANLYITGAATPGNWMGGGDPELLSQKFTKISTSEFEIASLAINPDAGFLFVPVYGDWANKYGFTGAGLGNNVNGDSFQPGGNDFKSPPLAGNYKIVVSFKTGKYTITKL